MKKIFLVPHCILEYVVGILFHERKSIKKCIHLKKGK